MRLREAMVLALRYDARLTRAGWAEVLKIEGGKFISCRFRARLGCQPEIRLTAADCLDDSWTLLKNGQAFLPPSA